MVNTHAGSVLSVCVTAQAADLNLGAFQALVYVPIGNVGSLGETGLSENILTYPVWDKSVAQKAKGMGDAGSPALEVARDSADAGQDALRAAGATNLNYAFKHEMNDKLTPGGTNTIKYNRGLVGGPTRPGGGNEDFDLEVFTLGLQQREIVVDPT